MNEMSPHAQFLHQTASLEQPNNGLVTQGHPPSYHIAGEPATSDREPDRTDDPDQAKPTASEWPTRPQCLKPSRWRSIWSIIVDSLLILVSAAFLALAIVALSVNNRPVGDSLGTTLEQASTLGPTVFPVVFAALFGRCLRHMGRFQVERKVRLVVLWQLINVRTLFDALSIPFQINNVTATTVLMLLLWSLSPLGGQASQRVVYKQNSTSVYTAEARYRDSGPGGQVLAAEGLILPVMDLRSEFPILRQKMDATLLQQLKVKQQKEDAWHNVKVPFIKTLEDANNGQDKDGWIDVLNTDSVESYVSLLGMPVVGIPQAGFATFNMETSYTQFDCRHKPWSGEREGGLSVGLTLACLDCLNQQVDSTALQEGNLFRRRRFLGVGDDPGEASLALNETMIAPRTVEFTQTRGGYGVSQILCSATQRLVEVGIECVSGHCQASRIRPSQTDHRNPNYTALDYWATSPIIPDEIGAFSATDNNGVDLISSFLNDTTLPPLSVAPRGVLSKPLNITDIPVELFSARASILVNTIFEIYLAPNGFLGNLTTNLAAYGPAHTPAHGLDPYKDEYAACIKNLKPPTKTPECLTDLSFGGFNRTNCIETLQYCLPAALQGLAEAETQAPFFGASTTATVTTDHLVYRPSTVWVAILFVSATLLIVAGAAGLWLSLRTIGPDVFDAVMGLTYDNPHLDVGKLTHGSTLDAGERARLMGHVHVRLGDVETAWGVGKIALGVAEEVGPLAKGRMYE